MTHFLCKQVYAVSRHWMGIKSCAEAGLELEKKEAKWRHTLERREEKRQKAQLQRAAALSGDPAAATKGASASVAGTTAAAASTKPAAVPAAGGGNSGKESDDEVVEVGELSLDAVLQVRAHEDGQWLGVGKHC